MISLRKLFGFTSSKPTPNRTPSRKRRRLGASIERLESRTMMDASAGFVYDAELGFDLLQIEGTENADCIAVFAENDLVVTEVSELSYDLDGEPVVGDLLLSMSFDPADVQAIRIRSLGGDDLVLSSFSQLEFIEGGEGNDGIIGGHGTSWIDGENGNDVILGGQGNDVIDGGPGEDTLLGGGGIDVINGGSDNDFIYGEWDSSFSDTSPNFLYGDEGDDWIYGAAGSDEIHGGTGIDRLFGFGGADFLYALSSDFSEIEFDPNYLFGGTGNDTLYGSFGADGLAGNEGDDILNGLDGNDWLFGNSGNDTLLGQTGNDNLVGGIGNDSLYGGADNDNLYGEDGLDYLFGDSGRDILDGGHDGYQDVLEGGGGTDFFIVHMVRRFYGRYWYWAMEDTMEDFGSGPPWEDVFVPIWH